MFDIETETIIIPKSDLKLEWKVYINAVPGVYNPFAIHKFPPFIHWLMNFCPFKFLSFLLKEQNGPGWTDLYPIWSSNREKQYCPRRSWLTRFIYWTVFYGLAWKIWEWQGKPGEWQGMDIK